MKRRPCEINWFLPGLNCVEIGIKRTYEREKTSLYRMNGSRKIKYGRLVTLDAILPEVPTTVVIAITDGKPKNIKTENKEISAMMILQSFQTIECMNRCHVNEVRCKEIVNSLVACISSQLEITKISYQKLICFNCIVYISMYVGFVIIT